MWCYRSGSVREADIGNRGAAQPDLALTCHGSTMRPERGSRGSPRQEARQNPGRQAGQNESARGDWVLIRFARELGLSDDDVPKYLKAISGSRWARCARRPCGS